MRVLQAVGWYYPSSVGGTEIYVEALARLLRAEGHEVEIAAPDAGGGERQYLHDGVPVYRYPIPAAPTRAEARGDVQVRGSERLHQRMLERQPDIVHFHTFVTGLGMHEVKAALKSGARVVATSHSARLGFVCQRGTMMRWGREVCDGVCEPAKCAECVLMGHKLPRTLARALAELPSPLSALVGRIPGPLGTMLGMSGLIASNQARQRDFLDSVDHFFVLTDAARGMVERNGAPDGKVTVNRLGVARHAEPKPRRPTSTPITVGYLGRFEDLKGVDDLVGAVTSLPRHVPLRLEVRGPLTTDAEKAVHAGLQRLALGDHRITFGPAVAPADAAQVLAGWDLLVCPSRNLEGGPTVALEAWAVGTPVIGTRIGGLAELVDDTVGALVEPGDRAALARLLGTLAAHPERIDDWRAHLPRPRTMREVASDYCEEYRRCIDRLVQ
jgi:glycosyltransferase involved in cell wall biosynthesis